MDQEDRIKELKNALEIAITALEGFYGSDAEDSRTLEYLNLVVNRKD